jgi:hypothetical protein
MSPMLRAFTIVENLLESPPHEMQRGAIIENLHRLLELSRDTEEAGLVAAFAAATMIYLDGTDPHGTPISNLHKVRMVDASHILRGAMSLRKARATQ